MTEFISRNYGSKEFEVIIKTDNKNHYVAAEFFARRLIDHCKPIVVKNVGYKWISVSEGVPEDFLENIGKKVIPCLVVYKPFKGTKIVTHCALRKYSNIHGWYFTGSKVREPTHWMLLPEFFEEVDK
jgi:hypothetical protein